MKTRICIAAMITLACIGCEKPAPEIVLVTAEPAQINMPAECTSRDLAWQALPDADVRRDAAARNYAANRRQYSELLGKRSVCRSAINAQQKRG